MGTVVDELRGGDPKSLGRSAEIALRAAADPSLLDELFQGVGDEDRAVRARCADAIEKAVAAKPEILHPHKDTVLRWMSTVEDWTVREHVCLLLPRLHLTARERRDAFEIARSYLSDRSSIVRTFAMQTMFELANQDADLMSDAVDVIEHALRSGTAAMKARARMLLRRVHRQG